MNGHNLLRKVYCQASVVPPKAQRPRLCKVRQVTPKLENMQGLTHYQTLELDSRATAEQIRSAYRRLAKLHHPDTGADAGHQRMISLNAAYEVLSQPERRRVYDHLLTLHQPTRLRVPYGASRTRPDAADEETARDRWLKEVYQPVNISIQQVLRSFRHQLEELSYDPYDDELVAEFEAYLNRSLNLYQNAIRTFRSRPNPFGTARVAEFLYHSLNQIGDALEELRYFPQNYDYQHLHTGQDLFRIAADLRRQAVEAAERIVH